MEIYLERIRDLLARRLCHSLNVWLVNHLISAQNDNLQIHEEKSKGVYVKNLSDYYVGSAKEVYEIMRQGGQARMVTSTSAFV
jgi:kinesin family member 5